jgi:diguanylate cyclase (GGDEF)-like protein
VSDIASSLLDAVRRLNDSLDPSRVLVRVCEEATRVLGASHASVFFGEPGATLRTEATYGRPAEAIGISVWAGEGLVGKVFERGEASTAAGELAVPLRWDGRLHGVLMVGHADGRLATGEELALLEDFADLAASACRNASVHAELALSARTDALTGCLNHAAMHDALHRELERAARHGHDLSLAIVDLDDFKQVNELHGHLAGDDVLRRVGQSLRHSVRAYDFVARYGGDEFAIVAVDADEDTAAEVARRALEAIGRAVRELGTAGADTTATAGVAQARVEDSPAVLIARADAALLHGKHRGGRGGPVLASSLPD